MAIGWLARAVLPYTSGLPSDVCVNDLAFGFSGTPSGSDLTALMVDVENFYSLPATGETFPTSYYLANILDRDTNAARVDIYEIPDTPGDLGSPVASDTFSLGSDIASADDYPYECAVALSFAADLTGIPEEEVNPSPPPATIRPRSRRRGRIFLGPLCKAGSTASGELRVGSSQTGLWVKDAQEFLGAGADSDGWTWSVWSRTDWTLYPIVTAWVDNTYDTIRARGIPATTRSELPIPS